MRNAYLIAYDICDPKRYRRVYKFMLGAGFPVQYSVFRCELTDVELQKLKASLWECLNHQEDRVMILNLGPIDGKVDSSLEYWGAVKPENTRHRAAVIV